MKERFNPTTLASALVQTDAPTHPQDPQDPNDWTDEITFDTRIAAPIESLANAIRHIYTRQHDSIADQDRRLFREMFDVTHRSSTDQPSDDKNSLLTSLAILKQFMDTKRAFDETLNTIASDFSRLVGVQPIPDIEGSLDAALKELTSFALRFACQIEKARYYQLVELAQRIRKALLSTLHLLLMGISSELCSVPATSRYHAAQFIYLVCTYLLEYHATFFEQLTPATVGAADGLRLLRLQAVHTIGHFYAHQPDLHEIVTPLLIRLGYLTPTIDTLRHLPVPSTDLGQLHLLNNIYQLNLLAMRAYTHFAEYTEVERACIKHTLTELLQRLSELPIQTICQPLTDQDALCLFHDLIHTQASIAALTKLAYKPSCAALARTLTSVAFEQIIPAVQSAGCTLLNTLTGEQYPTVFKLHEGLLSLPDYDSLLRIAQQTTFIDQLAFQFINVCFLIDTAHDSILSRLEDEYTHDTQAYRQLQQELAAYRNGEALFLPIETAFTPSVSTPSSPLSPASTSK